MSPDPEHNEPPPTSDEADRRSREGPDSSDDEPAPLPDDEDVDEYRPLPPSEIRMPDSPAGADRSPSESDVTLMGCSLEEAGGIINPIVVRPVDDPEPDEARYELVAGRVRLEAAVQRGDETVPCRVLALSDSEAVGLHAREDWTRKEESQLVRGWRIQRVLDRTGWSQAELCRMTTLSESQVSELVSSAELFPEDRLSQLAKDAGVPAERIRDQSRASLRKLKRVGRYDETEFREALGRILTDDGDGGSDETSSSEADAPSTPLEVADGCVRIDRQKLARMGVRRVLITVLRTIVALLAAR